MRQVCTRTAATLRRLALAVALAPALVAPLRAAEGEEPAADAATPELEAGDGRIFGHAFDSKSGNSIEGVTVTLLGPTPADGSPAREETRATDDEGAYEFDAVPEGSFTVRFTKDGYQSSRLEDFAVGRGEKKAADVALDPAKGENLAGVEEIVVTGEFKAPEANRELADEVINVMGPEELAKFAASDIAEAIKRIPGVNVVEGQFAIIRGLEDRYSSTLFNSAPVPSPDPNAQSVQLDLFPSDVTSNLVVAKTFSPDLPSNSSGGSINIITHEVPEDLEIKVAVSSGFNSGATDRFLQWHEGTPIGSEADPSDTIEGEVGATVGGRTLFAEREVTFRALFNWELDYATRSGDVQVAEPRAALSFPGVLVPGSLAAGELPRSGGHWDFTDSGRQEQTTGFVDIGFDLDREGNHRVDFSTFYTDKQEEVVQLRGDGFLPGFCASCYATLQSDGNETPPVSTIAVSKSAWFVRTLREDPFGNPDRGPIWSAAFDDSRTFERNRDLLVLQLNGEHDIQTLEGLRITWAANRSETNQDDSYYAARYFFEQDDKSFIPSEYPATRKTLAPGRYYANDGIFLSENEIVEREYFGRLDAEYERTMTDWLSGTLSGGLWLEDADRDVDSRYQEVVSVGGSRNFAVQADTAQELGHALAPALDQNPDGSFAGSRPATNESKREIFAWNLGLKLTFREDFDFLVGLRREDILLQSHNQAFTGESNGDGTPKIFPSAYLFFDRFDNPARAHEFVPVGGPPPGTSFNDQVLGIDVPVDPTTGLVDLLTADDVDSVMNGKIDETRNLPSVGLTYRPLDGLSVRAAYSQTVARPSFREMGYYVAVETGSDDLVVGNPQLQLSDVESWDGRVEYMWGDLGDLAALSGFAKKIDDPIESIFIRDPTNLEASSAAIYRTYFNNPNRASLWGLEAELRKAIDFVGVDALRYLSLATNFTWIDAEVERSALEVARAAPYFTVAPGADAEFPGLKKTRRLFGQPQWIVNGDLTFDHPDWGSKATLSVFAISDVLDGAGNVSIAPDGVTDEFNLDRYIGSYYQMDLTLSQTLNFDWMPGDWVLKMSVKNLTDSERKLIYDPAQTAHEIAERTYKIGRDFTFGLSYSRSF